MRRAIARSQKASERAEAPSAKSSPAGRYFSGRGLQQCHLDNDPTAHAEVNAIRRAAQRLGSFDLSGCDIYCPNACPMCLEPLLGIDRIFYANNRKDAARIGFDDASSIANCTAGSERQKKMELLPARRGAPRFRHVESDSKKRLTDKPGFCELNNSPLSHTDAGRVNIEQTAALSSVVV